MVKKNRYRREGRAEQSGVQQTNQPYMSIVDRGSHISSIVMWQAIASTQETAHIARNSLMRIATAPYKKIYVQSTGRGGISSGVKSCKCVILGISY